MAYTDPVQQGDVLVRYLPHHASGLKEGLDTERERRGRGETTEERAERERGTERGKHPHSKKELAYITSPSPDRAWQGVVGVVDRKSVV